MEFDCTIEGCDFKCKSNDTLKGHLFCKHDIGSGLICPQEGCDFKYINPSQLKDHLFYKHNMGNISVCPHDGCEFKYIRASKLKAHLWQVHNIGDKKIHVCPEAGCNSKFKQMCKLKTHLWQVHDIGDKEIHICPEDGCSHKSKTLGNLKRHLWQVHSIGQSDMHVCPEEGCSYKCKMKGDLKRHLWNVHDLGDGPIYNCPVEDCYYSCKVKHGINYHISFVHDIGDKECTICLKNVFTLTSIKDPKTKETYKGCRKCYRKITGYTSRVEKQMVVFLRKDDRISPYIISHDKITKGVECATKCRADLVIRSIDITIIIECDEFQHLRGKYEHLCEMARMDKLLDEFQDTKCVFIRWNPDNCKKDGKKYIKTIDERLKDLTELVLEIANNKYEESILVYYMYYDIDNRLITNRHPFKLLY